MPLTTTLAGGSALIKWLLRDEFTDTRAAGAVNGTPATPGPGTRVVVDTDGDALSVAGGSAVYTNTNNDYGDPGLWFDSFARVVGRVLAGQITVNTRGNASFGWDSDQASVWAQPYWWLQGSFFGVRLGGVAFNNTAYLNGDVVKLFMVTGTTNIYFLYDLNSAGIRLAYFVPHATDPVYPGLGSFSAIIDLDWIRIPDELYLPTPLAYDTFTRANGALGSSEAAGPDGQTAPVKVWVSGGATWTIAGNEAVNTPTEGGELVTNGDFAAWTGDNPDSWSVVGEVGADPEVSEVGAGQGHGGVGLGLCNLYQSATATQPKIDQNVFTVGDWYVLTLDVDTRIVGSILVTDGLGSFSSVYNSTGSKLVVDRAKSILLRIQGQSANSDVTIDNVSVKQLALNTLFSNVETGTADVVCQVELDTIVAGTQAGLVLNLDDKDTPANFVVAYHTGVRCKLEKCVAGVYTNVINAVTAYAAGATLVVIKEGTAYSLYYNNAKVGATSTVSDAGIIDNTLHGIFSTYSGNQLDNFLVMPRGTNGEYSALERYSS